MSNEQLGQVISGTKMIPFPKPFDWFQQKLWRLYWIEWYIVFCIFIFKDQLQYSHYEGFSFFSQLLYTFIIIAPIDALIIVFVGKYLVKALFGFTSFMFSMAGAKGFIHTMLEILETLMWIVIDINYNIISRFSLEKLSISPSDKFAQKMGWK